jgi:heat shock protein HtpX
MLFAGHNSSGERNVNPVVAILIVILAPIAAMLIQMAISRAREFEADREGAAISRDPTALASALEKIHNYAHQITNETAEAHPETGQMMIINPLSGGGISGLFSTHPQTEERVARLLAMANSY